MAGCHRRDKKSAFRIRVRVEWGYDEMTCIREVESVLRRGALDMVLRCYSQVNFRGSMQFLLAPTPESVDDNTTVRTSITIGDTLNLRPNLGE